MFAECCKERYGDLLAYANIPKIVLVINVKLKAAAASMDAIDTNRLVGSMIDGIKSFLNSGLPWQMPPLPIIDGLFCTKQIVVPDDNIKLSHERKETELNDIASRTCCGVRVTDDKVDGQLFSVTGRKEALFFAISLIKEALFLRDSTFSKTTRS